MSNGRRRPHAELAEAQRNFFFATCYLFFVYAILQTMKTMFLMDNNILRRAAFRGSFFFIHGRG